MPKTEQKKTRFSKAALADYLSRRAGSIVEHNGFDRNNGTHQILVKARRERWPLERVIEVAVQYGAKEMADELFNEFEL